MKNHWEQWLDKQIYLLSTPMGAGVGVASFVIGILIGRLILSAMRGF